MEVCANIAARMVEEQVPSLVQLCRMRPKTPFIGRGPSQTPSFSLVELHVLPCIDFEMP